MLSNVLQATAVASLSLLLALPALAEGITLRGSGSTFVAPAMKIWGEKFSVAYPESKVEYDAVGSGAGVSDFIEGRTDFGATERPMTDAEIAKVPQGVVHVPVAAGMVVVAYNLPGVEGQLRLSRATLAGIFAGTILQWNDPVLVADNPGLALPDDDIAIVVRRDASGTTFAFVNHIGAASADFATTGPGVSQLPDWPRKAMTAYGNEGVSARIAIAENSIGYVEYGFARRLGVPVAALENRAGTFVSPTAEAGATAIAEGTGAMLGDGRVLFADPEGVESYPIVTLSWMLLRETQDAPFLAPALRALVEIALGQGQAEAAEISYVPLPGPAILHAQVLLDRLR